MSGDFNCFWSLDKGWGEIEINENTLTIKVLYGKLTLNKIKLPANMKVSRITCDGKEINCVIEGADVILPNSVKVNTSVVLA